MFAEWLIEAYYLRIFMKLSHIPHYTTLQKFAEKINGKLLWKIISSFIMLLNINRLFIGIDSSGFKLLMLHSIIHTKPKCQRNT